jgi:hydroxymethylbilane synthase
VLRGMHAFEEHVIRTTGDATQASGERLADIGGKGLFSKEIHAGLMERRIDLAVHSLKDLESELPPGIVLACTLRREAPRDALVLGPGCQLAGLAPDDPWRVLSPGAVIGSASVRRQAQLLHRRPDLRVAIIRGNVHTRLERVGQGAYAATLLAMAGLRRLGLADRTSVPLDVETMVPSPGQGIVGITVRESDEELRDLLAAIEEPEARAVSLAERAMTAALDGSCRTPIGAYARLLDNGRLHLTGLVARKDGSFLLKRSCSAPVRDAARLGHELGESLRADAPADVLA